MMLTLLKLAGSLPFIFKDKAIILVHIVQGVILF